MKIAVYHGNFASVAGGGEVAALKLVKALKELGHEVDLYTSFLDEEVARLVCENVGICPAMKIISVKSACNKIFSILSERLPLTSMWILSWYSCAMEELFPKINELSEEYDIVIADQSPAVASASYILPGDIMYFHGPAMLTGLGPLAKYIPEGSEPFVRLYKKLISGMEFRTFIKVMCNKIATRKVIANSTWTKGGLLEVNTPFLLGAPRFCKPEVADLLRGADVVYPPVDYESLSSMYDSQVKRDLVLTVARYDPGKKLWFTIYVASMLPNIHFVIAGTTRTAHSAEVLAQLEFLVDKLRIKNVTLERDVPRRRLLDLYAEARNYLHPPFTESFGIAIAEGAAAGAVPVVYRDGGGWIDIAAKIDQSLGYTTVEEAATILRQLLSSQELWLRLSKRSIEIAADFSWDSYKRKLDAAAREARGLKRHFSPG